MKIIFVGTVDFSLFCLQKLIDLKADIAGVITKKQSSFNSDFADLYPIANKENIPVLFTEDINEKESINWIRSKAPDVVFCFGWSSILKEDILKIAPMGVLGFHPAALPQNRGRHPIIWALSLGLNETASTFFFMDKGADSGPILSQIPVKIESLDDAASLYRKITDTALSQIEGFLPLLISNNFALKTQDNSRSNYWRKRNKEDGKIDWRMSSKAIYNLVRALTRPYVGAHAVFKGAEIKIWKVSVSEENPVNIEPGKVLKVINKTIFVKTCDGVIEILEHEFLNIPKPNDYL